MGTGVEQPQTQEKYAFSFSLVLILQVVTSVKQSQALDSTRVCMLLCNNSPITWWECHCAQSFLACGDTVPLVLTVNNVQKQ